MAYTKLHKDDYSAIFWLNIKDENSLKYRFARTARRIFKEPLLAGQPSIVPENSSLDEVVDAVKRWLDYPKNSQWLMVFENYDNPKVAGNTDDAAVDIRRFLPEVHHGSIIITTRSSKSTLAIV